MNGTAKRWPGGHGHPHTVPTGPPSQQKGQLAYLKINESPYTDCCGTH